MRVLILGGDGYLGWPTAMHLSAQGHETAVADNYLRRNLCREVDAPALYPVPTLSARCRLWKEVSGRDIASFVRDLRVYEEMAEVFREFRPEGVVHYAEQPSAPYSMLDRKAARLTLDNNLQTTLNLVYAVREFAPSAQIVKLGTMGEYGTPNIDIEEGWIDIEHKGRSDRFLFPRQAGSLYHTTKIMDTDMLWLYARLWGLAVTDLMQGPVYGIVTDQTERHPGLRPFFNYDAVFGTVLNRFVVQAVSGCPLTVYGKGGQTRGYINIRDTLECVHLAVENPAAPGELRVFNQYTETFSVLELAERVRRAGSRLGLDVAVEHLDNPRTEAESHYYNPAHSGLTNLGLVPHLLDEDALVELMGVVGEFADHVDPRVLRPEVSWK
ncbi:NAD-dependent epimerase/dehydratase family protein [Pseudodesulfovibrio karagichevae]|uniref:NAD-dependent epimerase/dehydratase family protein n=1 Tax=Pseudodesulfovibrio karagichevae TaxID=3239305 RepID=A0ABV4K599_9BACT